MPQVDQVFLGIGEVFPSIGQVGTSARFELRQEVGVQRRRVLSFLRLARNVLGTLQVVGKEASSGRHRF